MFMVAAAAAAVVLVASLFAMRAHNEIIKLRKTQ